MYKKKKYDFFSTRELKACGWLKNQLRLQADGLNGNLDKVWPYIRNSSWIGGDVEDWERVPYWLDGFIPLAYLLEDAEMIERAKKYVNAIMDSQQEDGWICPCSPEQRGNYDTWAILLLSKVLAVYGECSGDTRVIEVLSKCLKQFYVHINGSTLRTWGAARWFEGLIAVFWLYEQTHEEWLIKLAYKLKIEGIDWRVVLESGVFAECTKVDEWDLFAHVVNVGMALKSEALMSLIMDIDGDELAEEFWNYLQKKHSTASGYFTGDENVTIDSPIRGTELCGVVETMFSCEYLFAITGKEKWLTRLEKLAYNTLPAAVSPDMWSHQYDQMTNQVACFPMSKQPFGSNTRDAHIFGLEPNFGCCTANFGQGWPKFALATFMKAEDGIASCALAPAMVQTEIEGVKVKCELVTDYPFRNVLTYKVEAERAVTFTLSIRIPSCAVKATVDGINVPCGEFHKICREWEDRQSVKVELTFEPTVVERPGDMICIWRGSLLYAVAIDEKWEKVEYAEGGVERKYPYCDYYIYPLSKWNYALVSTEFEVKENNFKNAFETTNPPIEMIAEMVEIPWGFNHGHCDERPQSCEPISEVTKVKLIPYGCTNLRMAEIPYIKK